MSTPSYETYTVVGMAVDPIHVGTGGARLGRVDLSIVRDPVTKIPKIPGSSLAGVYRTYAAMAQQEADPNRQLNNQLKPYYPDCAGLGQPDKQDKQGQGGHCGQADCPICTVFGFARGRGGGFAGLAAFSDAQVLLFPVATREGPVWVTCPDALRLIGCEVGDKVQENAIYRSESSDQPLNLGWLLLEVEKLDCWQTVKGTLDTWHDIPQYIRDRVAVISDRLFSHVVNSNLEARTSVSINPETGAAEERALFTYEALPRSTVLLWQITCKNPKHFRVGNSKVEAEFNCNGSNKKIGKPENVFEVTKTAHPYLEHLGIGGMGTRGMGRIQVLSAKPLSEGQKQVCAQPESSATQQGGS